AKPANGRPAGARAVRPARVGQEHPRRQDLRAPRARARLHGRPAARGVRHGGGGCSHYPAGWPGQRPRGARMLQGVAGAAGPRRRRAAGRAAAHRRPGPRAGRAASGGGQPCRGRGGAGDPGRVHVACRLLGLTASTVLRDLSALHWTPTVDTSRGTFVSCRVLASHDCCCSSSG
ncbi:unnamed protein product, partial [Prorocentrum cordatum]